MKSYASGEIVLISFPFSETHEIKRRPAMVLMDTGDDDIIVARITSQGVKTQYDVEITNWKDAGLLLPSVVRLHKVATLSKKLIEQKLGKLKENDWEEVKKTIKKMCIF